MCQGHGPTRKKKETVPGVPRGKGQSLGGRGGCVKGQERGGGVHLTRRCRALVALEDDLPTAASNPPKPKPGRPSVQEQRPSLASLCACRGPFDAHPPHPTDAQPPKPPNGPWSLLLSQARGWPPPPCTRGRVSLIEMFWKNSFRMGPVMQNIWTVLHMRLRASILFFFFFFFFCPCVCLWLGPFGPRGWLLRGAPPLCIHV